MKVIIHYKFTKLADAPDEIYNLLKKYETDKIKFYLIKRNVTVLQKLIKKHSDDEIIIHFHNSHIKADYLKGVKKIIQYHSEPFRVTLDVDESYKKLVLNQYHCTLQEYSDCQPVRNFYVNDRSIVFNDKIKIGYFPSIITRHNKYYDKGYTQTNKILGNIERMMGDMIIIDIGTGLTYHDCIERKRDCHIIIDECVTGSFHKSTIEGLMLGAVVFVWINDAIAKKHINLYNKILPVINTHIDDLEKSLVTYINKGKRKLEKLAKVNNEIFRSYWDTNDVANEYIDIYNNI